MTYQSESEFKRLLEHFQKLTPRNAVLEIGSLHGETLSFWLQHMKKPGLCISIDLMVSPTDPRYAVQKRGHEMTWPLWANQNGVTFYCFNSDSRAPGTLDAVRYFLPVIDFLMIDGGHDYATCKADWENYGPLVRPGGLVAFHDLGREWPDVRRVWEEARKGHVSEEIVESPERYGIGILWK